MKPRKESSQIVSLRRLIRETILKESVEEVADLLYGPALDYFEEKNDAMKKNIVVQTYNTWPEPVVLDNIGTLASSIQAKILEEYEQEVPAGIVQKFLEELSKVVKENETQLSLFK